MGAAPPGSPAATLFASMQAATSQPLDPRRVDADAALAAAGAGDGSSGSGSSGSGSGATTAAATGAKPPPVWATASELKPCSGGFGCQRPAAMHCAACKRVSYCSQPCQARDWPAHKPFCQRMRAEGAREPSAATLAAAAEAEAAKRAEQIARSERENAAREAADRAWAERDCRLFRPSWLHTCEGERRRSDIAAGCFYELEAAARKFGLERPTTTNFGPLPPGVEVASGRGFYLRSQVAPGDASGSHLLVMMMRLFADGGEGALVGHSLEGLFVARGPLAADGPDQTDLFKMNFQRVAPVTLGHTGVVDLPQSVGAMLAAVSEGRA